MKRNLLYLFLFPILNFGQVIVDSIYIETQFYGPFNKTRAEITLFNNSLVDSVEDRFHFLVNKSAFIKNILLVNDGKFENITNLNRPLPSKYAKRGRIKTRRSPRYLTGSSGSYYLTIYPFMKYQKRKIIIEYFSISENDGHDKHSWIFKVANSPDYTKSIRIKSYQPIGTKLFFNSNKIENFNSLNDSAKSIVIIDTLLLNPSELNISFDYNITKVVSYSYDSTRYYQVVDTSKKYYHLDFRDKYPPHEILRFITDFSSDKKITITSIIRNPKSFIYADKAYQFYNDMLKYLSKFPDITYTEFRQKNDIDIIQRFFGSDSSNLYLVESINETNIRNELIEIECPYLTNFPSYFKNIKVQGMETYEYEEEFVHMGFFAVEKMPEPIGGLDSIQAKLFYPNKILASIEGRVYIKAKVNSEGYIVKIQTIRGLHSVLDKISHFAVSNIMFTPAQQRGKNISLDITVPLTFICDSTVLPTTSPDYHIGNAIYNLKMGKGKLILFDKNVDLNKMSTIQFLSDKYFELLINQTELLGIIYKVFYLSELDGLVVCINNNGVNETINIVR